MYYSYVIGRIAEVHSSLEIGERSNTFDQLIQSFKMYHVYMQVVTNVIFYHRPTKLQEGKVFLLCLSFHGGMGVGGSWKSHGTIAT